MKIIIMGAGTVGQELCDDLTKEDHDITLIESDSEVLDEMLNDYDINGILGNGASYEIQSEAGVDTADIFISVTDNDELNLISSVLAKNIGARVTIARARNQEYLHMGGVISEVLGIDYIVNPELEAAEHIRRLIAFPQAISYESFTTKGEAPIVEMRISENSNLIGKMLAQFRSVYNNIIVCAAGQGDLSIPKGDYVIKPDDHLYVTGPINELLKLFKENGQTAKKIKSIFIVGGGLLTKYILRVFEHSKIQIKVIEIDKEVGEDLSLDYPYAEIIHDDGTTTRALKEQRVDHYDAFFALTGIDEENIIISMVAHNLGVGKLVTRISKDDLYEIVDVLGLDSTISPKKIIADKILQKVRALENTQGSNVEALYRMANDQVEAVQFRVKKDSQVTNAMIKDLPIKPNILIAYIKRRGQVIFPKGTDTIQENDRVIIISQDENLSDVDEILK